MELRHLKYFIAVAEELHFGRAARRLHMAQPPLSTQIRQLEDELGLALFHRANRRVTLTPAGHVFLAEARDILQRVEAGVQQARRADEGHAGTLTIGYVDEAVHFVLPPLLAQYRQLYPDVTIHLKEMHSSQQEAALECRVIDIALGYTRPASAAMMVRTVLSGDIVLAMPASHPLARRRSIDLASLTADGFIFPVRQSSPHLHDFLMSLCHDAGLVPRIAHRAEHVYSVMGLVRCGAGVSLIPAFLRAEEWSSVVFKKLTGSTARLDMMASWCNDLTDTRLYRHFIDLLPGR